MTYVNEAVPFHTIGNRQVLMGRQLYEEPWLVDFIERFPNCFEHDPIRCWFVFWPEGDAPNPIDLSILRRIPAELAGEA